jgi:beta-phosphoglucomutase-like phosphatase (HAD superfamily)/dTDP-glucose pyrophosphorylase
MIRTIIFDLDGVLFNGVELHSMLFLKALNLISPDTPITKEYHDKYLNGMSTRQKADCIVSKGFLSKDNINILNKVKQELTVEYLNTHNLKNTHIYSVVSQLSSRYQLYCVSNSKKETVLTILTKMDILTFFSGVVSNDDIKDPKPSPEPYLFTAEKYNLNLQETLILEDSYHGRCSAYASTCHVLPIVDVQDVTLDNIETAIDRIQKELAQEIHINIVIPMAGHGSRFAKNGYSIPKPFIPVFGKPMIQWVIENMLPKDETYDGILVKNTIVPHFHFVAQEQHLRQYDLSGICNSLNIDYTITTVDKVTEGPACTVLLTEQYINNDWPLVTVNSDQYLEWDINNFYRSLLNPSFSGCINTFYQPNQSDIKWSYVKINDLGDVTEVAEKKWLSPLATSGIYGWKSGREFVECAKEMIEKNERVNNEFYVCPVYNHLIQKNKRVRTFNCKKLWGLGVPEDLENFIKYYAYE